MSLDMQPRRGDRASALRPARPPAEVLETPPPDERRARQVRPPIVTPSTSGGGGGIFKSAAVGVLRKERRLMTTGDITRVAIDSGLIKVQGKTPEATMASALYTDVKKKLDKSVFTRPQEGLFGLREWIQENFFPEGWVESNDGLGLAPFKKRAVVMSGKRNLQGRGSKSSAQHAAALEEDHEMSDEAADEEQDVEDEESDESEDERMGEDGEVEVHRTASMDGVASTAAASDDKPVLNAGNADTQSPKASSKVKLTPPSVTRRAAAGAASAAAAGAASAAAAGAAAASAASVAAAASPTAAAVKSGVDKRKSVSPLRLQGSAMSSLSKAAVKAPLEAIAPFPSTMSQRLSLNGSGPPHPVQLPRSPYLDSLAALHEIATSPLSYAPNGLISSMVQAGGVSRESSQIPSGLASSKKKPRLALGHDPFTPRNLTLESPRLPGSLDTHQPFSHQQQQLNILPLDSPGPGCFMGGLTSNGIMSLLMPDPLLGSSDVLNSPFGQLLSSFGNRFGDTGPMLSPGAGPLSSGLQGSLHDDLREQSQPRSRRRASEDGTPLPRPASGRQEGRTFHMSSLPSLPPPQPPPPPPKAAEDPAAAVQRLQSLVERLEAKLGNSHPQVGKAWLALARLCQHSAAKHKGGSESGTESKDGATAATANTAPAAPAVAAPADTAAAASATATASSSRFYQLALMALKRAKSVQQNCAAASSSVTSPACSEAFSYLEGRLVGEVEAPVVVRI